MIRTLIKLNRVKNTTNYINPYMDIVNTIKSVISIPVYL